MKFSKIYLAFLFVFLSFPILIAHFAITGQFPVISNFSFPDNTYIEPLKYSLANAVICASVSTIIGSVSAGFFSEIKEKIYAFFSDDAVYQVYIFAVTVVLVLWGMIYICGKKAESAAAAHSMICIPLVFCAVKSASKDAMHTIRCAAEIGSSPIQTFINVIFPDIMPSVIAGLLASFSISFNDIIITPIITRNTVQTFSLKLIDYMKNGYDMGTVCIVMLILSLMLSIAVPTLCIKNKN